MQALMSIDDTDNQESPGSGSLAELLAQSLLGCGLIARYSSISRHQLFVNEFIPYTSHNSSMCFSIEARREQTEDIIDFAGSYLASHAAPGSDPGLCVAIEGTDSNRDALIDFGRQAKHQVLSTKDAFAYARKAHVHLSAHGGTGCGVIGALAGIGLRLSGNDGRFRGWLSLGKTGDTIQMQKLCLHPLIEGVVTNTREVLSAETEITFAQDHIKTVLHAHRQVIPVARVNGTGSPVWTTLTRAEMKRF